MSRLLSLDEPDALDVERVGAKAARLAEARQRGFSVLPGLVVAAEESRVAIEAGRVALASRSAGAARSAVISAGMTTGLGRELARAADLGPVLVVRSSTRLDGDGAWSGAFASFRDVMAGDLDTAVRGCWASLFSPDTLARFDQQGIPPETAEMAVLVQPQLEPAVGGWTRIIDECVEIAAIAGSPAALLEGWERGSRYVVDADGSVQARQPSGPLDSATAAVIANLARLARDELAAGRLEWALVNGKVVILQLDPLDSADGDDSLTGAIPAALTAPPFRRLVGVLVGRSGRLGDRLLVPWAAAAPDSWLITPVDGAPVALFDEAKRLSRELNATVTDATGMTSEQLVEGLDGADPIVAGRLTDVTIDGAKVGRLLGAVDRVGRHLAAKGSLSNPESIWSQTAEWVDHALISPYPRPAARSVGDRWAHLIYGVTVVHGRPAPGTSASDGWAAGRARLIARLGDVGTFRSRDVLVVNRPLPKLAPLLWEASALVCRNGSPAAHLCEVARSLRVPAVVSADIPSSIEGISAAVDGTAGTVYWWDPIREPWPIGTGRDTSRSAKNGGIDEEDPRRI